MLDHVAPARRRLLLAVVAMLLLGVTMTAVAVGLKTGDDGARAPVDQSVPGPVLLVPGYGGSTTSLQVMASALRETGHDVTVVTLPDRAQGDLDQQATVLGQAADAALERSHANSVDIVGYSAGGVVSRLWAVEDGGADKVRRLVTLGAPHHGTELAALGQLVAGACPVACQQLVTDSPLLTQLLDAPLPSGPAYLSLWSTSDDVVLPPQSAVLPDVPSPSLQSICPASRTRHSALPTDPQVIAMVEQALAATPIPTWTRADCAGLSS